MSSLDISVTGSPVAQGNHTKNRWGAIYEKTKGHAEWRETVTLYAKAAIADAGWETTDAPVVVSYTFRMAAPKRRLRIFPSVKPDLSKLVRAVEDSLTDAGVWKDDGQVVSMVAHKRYPQVGEVLGVDISVSTIDDIDPLDAAILFEQVS